MLLFELLILPALLARFGIKTPQRVGSIIIVPVIALLPGLASLHGKGPPPAGLGDDRPHVHDLLVPRLGEGTYT